MRLFPVALAMLWLQLFWSLVPTWRFGEYYSYGWFVPFLAALLAWRRWPATFAAHGGVGESPAAAAAARLPRGLMPALVLVLVALIPLRFVATADPTWRPPLLLHAALVAGFTHVAAAQLWGRRVSLSFLPVTVFALSAVPYPWQLEQQLVRALTGMVVGLTREIFLLGGQPVELLGERLAIGSNVVEVTGGCSGIRSLQSLVMVALCFGEWLLLSIPRRLGLVAVAAACAIGVNTLRALWLAQLHFHHGKQAAAAAHDLLGHAAFLLSAAILFLTARALLPKLPPGRLILRRSQVAPQ